jgi:hypothetical protein
MEGWFKKNLEEVEAKFKNLLPDKKPAVEAGIVGVPRDALGFSLDCDERGYAQYREAEKARRKQDLALSKEWASVREVHPPRAPCRPPVERPSNCSH